MLRWDHDPGHGYWRNSVIPPTRAEQLAGCHDIDNHDAWSRSDGAKQLPSKHGSLSTDWVPRGTGGIPKLYQYAGRDDARECGPRSRSRMRWAVAIDCREASSEGGCQDCADWADGFLKNRDIAKS